MIKDLRLKIFIDISNYIIIIFEGGGGLRRELFPKNSFCTAETAEEIAHRGKSQNKGSHKKNISFPQTPFSPQKKNGLCRLRKP